MTTLTLELDDDLTAFLEEQVRNGRYASPQDVMRDAVRALAASDKAKLEALRAYLEPRIAAADRGEFVKNFSMADVIAEADGL